MCARARDILTFVLVILYYTYIDAICNVNACYPAMNRCGRASVCIRVGP